MRTRNGFAPSQVKLPEEWIGPEPVGEAMAQRLSVQQGLLMSGRAGPGTPYGLQGGLEETDNAYLVGVQDYQGNVQMGATTRIIADPEPAFPSTKVPRSLDDLFNPWSSIS